MSDLPAVLDTLLPSWAGLPGAGALGLDVTGAPVDRVLEALPSGFRDLDADGRETALRELERSRPDDFAELVRLAYCAYYTHARVLAAVGAATGYRHGPPQPGGYELDPFDESVVDAVRRRGAACRDA